MLRFFEGSDLHNLAFAVDIFTYTPDKVALVLEPFLTDVRQVKLDLACAKILSQQSTLKITGTE